MTDRMSKEELQARVNAMSKDEAQDALTFLIGWTPEGVQEAIEFNERIAANRARIRAERQPSPCPGGPSLPADPQPRGEHPYPASRYGYAPDSPLGRYDRDAHKAWYERTHPDGDHWPRQPLTDDEAAEAIADYEGTGEQS